MSDDHSNSGLVFRFHVHGADRDDPTLPALTSFLYDLNLLFELARLATDPRYEHYRFSRWTTYRNARRLDARDRLMVEQLSLRSPLDLSTTVIAVAGAVGGVWALTQTVERLANWKLTRRKLRAEVEVAEEEAKDVKSRAELSRIRVALGENPERWQTAIDDRGASEQIDRTRSHIERSDVQVEEFAIDLIRRRASRDE